MIEHYLLPLSPFLFAALTCTAFLAVFASLKNEIRTLKRRLAHERNAGADSIQELRRRLDELRQRLPDADERAAQLPKLSLNVSKRSQVIRLSRRGERAENIAASLSMPRREVDLLLKVYAIVLNGPRASGNPTPT